VARAAAERSDCGPLFDGRQSRGWQSAQGGFGPIGRAVTRPGGSASGSLGLLERTCAVALLLGRSQQEAPEGPRHKRRDQQATDLRWSPLSWNAMAMRCHGFVGLAGVWKPARVRCRERVPSPMHRGMHFTNCRVAVVLLEHLSVASHFAKAARRGAGSQSHGTPILALGRGAGAGFLGEQEPR
jgi:hypothetical protein